MKQQIKLLIGVTFTSFMTYSQVPTGIPPASASTPASCPPILNQAWFRGGNNNINTNTNIFGTAAGFNSNIWHQTNGFSRMLMEKGLGTQTSGRVAYGNNLPGTFVPVDRLHLYEVAITGAVQTRYQNTNTGITTTDGYALGVNNVTRDVNSTQYENRPMRWLLPDATAFGNTKEWMRIDNGNTNALNAGQSTDGFIGLNNPTPAFHIDGVTPAINSLNTGGGELFMSFRTSDVLGSRMGMANATGLDGIMLPTFFGNIDSSQKYAALNTIGAIKANQDIAANTHAVTRFISGREWRFNQLGITKIDEVANRDLFSWQNAGETKMLMNSRGLVRIGVGLGALTTPARNRVEISANGNGVNDDPYGTQIATNGASGLRFTYLTSAKIALANGTNGIDNTKVLSVDSAGNVVLVNAQAGNTTTGNNGISVSNTGLAQLGVPCTATPAQITATQLTENRQLPTNGFNFNYTGTGKVGIGLANNSCAPANKLEIDNTTANTSGLRLTRLTNASPAPAGNGKVLSVDANGDVVLVKDDVGAPAVGTFAGSQNGLSNIVSATNPTGKVELGGTLLHPTQINTLNNNFELNYASGGNISIGENPNIYTTTSNQANIAIGLSNIADSPSNGNIMLGIQNHSYSNANGNKTIGLRNKLFGSGNLVLGEDNTVSENGNLYSNVILGHHNDVDGFTNWAVGSFNKILQNTGLSYAYGNQNYVKSANSFAIGNYVVNNRNYRISIGNAHDPSSQNALINYLASNPDATAHNDATIAGYNIIPAINIASNNCIGIKKYEPQVALDVAGSIASPVALQLSDSTLKTNIHTLNINAVAKLKQFRAVTYEWINKLDTAMYGTQYGFTAQQIESVMPDFVKTGNDGIKTLNQSAMIPLLVKAIQQQQSKIDSLTTKLNKQDSINQAVQQQLASLLADMRACCANTVIRKTNTAANQLEVELSDKNAVVLNQNVPNPFAEQTTISYNVPVSVAKAQLLFYSNEGKLIQTLDIATRGKGTVNVFANDLSSGLYHYTLVVDGKVADSKKMIRE